MSAIDQKLMLSCLQAAAISYSGNGSGQIGDSVIHLANLFYKHVADLSNPGYEDRYTTFLEKVRNGESPAMTGLFLTYEQYAELKSIVQERKEDTALYITILKSRIAR